MNLEEQVISLELSKRLRELGVNQESLFYWNRCSMCEEDWHLEKGVSSDYKQYSAFTVAELGQMIPIDKDDFYISIDREDSFGEFPKKWCVQFVSLNNKIHEDYRKWDDTLANAIAKMLIHLIENGLVNVEDLK